MAILSWHRRTVGAVDGVRMAAQQEPSAAKRRRLEGLTAAVLKEVKPSDAEIRYANSIVNELMARLRAAAPRSVEILLVGSVARGTQLRGAYDIDIFLLFPKGVSREQLERRGLKIARDIVDRGKGERYVMKYAEHPYIRLFLRHGTVKSDIVPAYKVGGASEVVTAVDRTQLHNEFVNAYMSQQQRDEVRVLKAFMHEHGIYGAEASTEGFSGYLCELLIYHYGGFVELLEQLSTKSLPLVIEPLGRTEHRHGSAEESALLAKFGSRFVVVDPIDPGRNVAANVSDESYARLALSARKLLAAPTMANFLGARYATDNASVRLRAVAKRLGCRFYALRIGTDDVADDIIWHQLKRAHANIISMLERNGFRPLLALANTRNGVAAMGFMINALEFGSVIRYGPEASMAGPSDAFLRAHAGSIVTLEGSRIVAVVPASHRTAGELLAHVVASRKRVMPTHLRNGAAMLYENRVPEECAKLLYEAYMAKTSI